MLEREGNGDFLFNGDRVSVLMTRRALVTDGGGSTTLRTYLCPWTVDLGRLR